MRAPIFLDGIVCELIPFPATEFDALKLAAAGAVASQRVKLTKIAADKSRTCPLGGALEFKLGKDLSRDPLRVATVVGSLLICSRRCDRISESSRSKLLGLH